MPFASRTRGLAAIFLGHGAKPKILILADTVPVSHAGHGGDLLGG